MCKKFLCVMWDNEQTLEYKEAVGICLGTVISNFFSQYVVASAVVDSREAVRNEETTLLLAG